MAADSAGTMLALAQALVLRLRARGLPLPSSLALLSPLADLELADESLDERAGRDPMVRKAWLKQALAAYACPPQAFEHRPLAGDLAGLPPLLVQAGSEEILLPHATRLAAHARLRRRLPARNLRGTLAHVPDPGPAAAQRAFRHRRRRRFLACSHSDGSCQAGGRRRRSARRAGAVLSPAAYTGMCDSPPPMLPKSCSWSSVRRRSFRAATMDFSWSGSGWR